MKTPDEIKKGLEFAETNCLYVECCEDICPYNKDCDVSDPDRMAEMPRIIATDALAYIQQLEERCKTLNQLRDAAAGRALKMEERVHQLERERDAAVADLRIARNCRTCESFNHEPSDQPCLSCGVGGKNYKWRGVKDTRTGASDGCTGASGV